MVVDTSAGGLVALKRLIGQRATVDTGGGEVTVTAMYGECIKILSGVERCEDRNCLGEGVR